MRLRGTAPSRVAETIPAPAPDIPVHWDDSDEKTEPGLPPTETRHPSELTRILFVPDTHRPFHDRVAWAVMLAAARGFQPHEIVVLGDFVDCYSISDHDKDPSRCERLADEVADAKRGLRELRALGAERHYYTAGNHEFRIERLIGRMPALHGLSGISLREMLSLEADGWHLTPYRQYLKLGKLYITHDTGDAGLYAHVRAGAVFEHNVVIGHTHRMATYFWGNATNETHIAAMFGWLGSVPAASYEHEIRKRKNWQHGFGVGYREADGTTHLQAVPIINGRCVLNGTTYLATAA